MENKSTLENILKQYLIHFPAETKRQEGFSEFLSRNVTDQLYTRKNFDGHLTASAFILNNVLDKILLIHHKSLGKWLQPGGHIDTTDPNILQAAYREVFEETGIPKDQLLLIKTKDDTLPFDIDSHHIPANPKKNEEGHYHHDFRYLFQYTGARDITINTEESLGYKWVDLEQLVDDDIFGGVVAKLKSVSFPSTKNQGTK